MDTGARQATLAYHLQAGGLACLSYFQDFPGQGRQLAQALARNLNAGYVRIGTIEDALLTDGCDLLIASGAGYRVAYAMAEDNLRLGRTVVADSVNPIKLTREAWRDVGKRSGSMVVDAQTKRNIDIE